MTSPRRSQPLPDRMTAAEYRAMVGLAPAGATQTLGAQRGRWGISAARSRRPGLPAGEQGEAACSSPQKKKPKNKYGNEPVLFEGEWYDSGKELAAFHKLRALRHAADPLERVVRVERQVKFEVVPKQQGERRACYIADFVAHMASGARRVIDVKSEITRKLPTYVLKRKLMLQVHDVRIEEW